MNKFTALIGVVVITLFWTTSALADKPIKEIQKGKIQRHHGIKEIKHGDILRTEGQQKIKAGTELIQSGNKDAGKALIQDGVDDIHDANKLHREGVHDVHQGDRNIIDGKKNIRDRDHD